MTRAHANRISVSVDCDKYTPSASFKTVLHNIKVTTYVSPEDGCLVVELDTDFEPTGSLRVWVNDEKVSD